MTESTAAYTENLIIAQGADAETSALDGALTAEQRARVFTWIEDREEDFTTSVKRIFAEFGTKVSKDPVRRFYQARKIAIAKVNLREQTEAAKELLMSGTDADTVEEAVIAMLINRAMEVVNQDKITPSLYREVVGLVVRLREQRISMERLRLERARFELDVADLVMKLVGIDIGRSRDLTVCTVLEYVDRKFYTRAVIRLPSMPFKQQTAILIRILDDRYKRHIVALAVASQGQAQALEVAA